MDRPFLLIRRWQLKNFVYNRVSGESVIVLCIIIYMSENTFRNPHGGPNPNEAFSAVLDTCSEALQT